MCAAMTDVFDFLFLSLFSPLEYISFALAIVYAYEWSKDIAWLLSMAYTYPIVSVV
jgi:hypothetical protein